jgi:hypothetical protein
MVQMINYRCMAAVLIFFSLLLYSVEGSAVRAERDYVYDSQGERNPFIPLVTAEGRLLQLEKPEASKKALNLEGIIYDKYGITYAIVNGTVIRIGDYLAGFQVLKIEKNKVVLVKEGQVLEILLKEEK